MTTVWEPDLDELRASVAEMEGRAIEEEEDASKQGTKRKRGPSHEGAVRAWREASVEVQGVRSLSAREVATYVQGVRWGLILRARSSAL